MNSVIANGLEYGHVVFKARASILCAVVRDYNHGHVEECPLFDGTGKLIVYIDQRGSILEACALYMQSAWFWRCCAYILQSNIHVVWEACASIKQSPILL